MGREPVPPEGLTTRSPTEPAVEAFLDHLHRRGRRAPGTLRAYRTDLTQFSRFLHVWVRDGAPSLSRLDDETAAAFAAELRSRGMKPSTVTRKVAAVRALGRYLAGLGLLARAPRRHLAGQDPVPAVSGTAPLSPSRMAAVLELASGPGFGETRDRVILEVLYGSGLRLAELESLNLSSVDLEAGTVSVTSPGGEERTVPLTAPAVAALRRYLPRRAESLIDREVGDLEAGALFVGARGRRLHRRSIQRAVGRYLEEAGRAEERGDANGGREAPRTGSGPRALRQAFAAHLLAAGADTASVRALLGQEAMPSAGTGAVDLQTLRQRYNRAHPRA